MDDNRLNRIESKIDTVTDKVDTINQILAQQHESLKYHIKRTDLLEQQIAPLRRRDINITFMIQLIIYIAAILGAIEAYKRIFG